MQFVVKFRETINRICKNEKRKYAWKIKKKCNKELTTLKLILKNINSGHYLYRLKIKRNIKILEDVLKH